jgi:hypothetical protein
LKRTPVVGLPYRGFGLEPRSRSGTYDLVVSQPAVDLLQAAREAMERQAWQEAYDAFAEPVRVARVEWRSA